MRSISYRTKLRLRKLLKVLAVIAIILIVILAVTFIYLDRYVIYTPDGAKIEKNMSEQEPDAPAVQTEPTRVAPEDVHIVFDEPTQDISEEEAFSGYYIDIAMLQDPQAVYDAVKALEEPTVVMIDLKSSSGMFYYSTDIEGALKAEIDFTVVDNMLSYLRTHGFKVIARIQAFRDRAYALEHQANGLAIKGGALWSDEGYYWIDPGEEIAVDYLQQIVKELAAHGITEIVLDDFYFPESTSIVYRHDASRTEVINKTAASLLSSFSGTNITLSFGNSSTDIKISDKRSHIIVDGIDATKVNTVLESYHGLNTPERQIVFLTTSKDTRFDGCNVLRPLIQK